LTTGTSPPSFISAETLHQSVHLALRRPSLPGKLYVRTATTHWADEIRDELHGRLGIGGAGIRGFRKMIQDKTVETRPGE